MKILLLAFALLAPIQDDPKILEILDRLWTEDSTARREALAALQDAGAAAVPLALRTLAHEAPGLAERIDKFVEQLGSRDFKVRDEASTALARMGRKAQERLGTHEKSANPEIAWRVKAALAAIREKEKAEQAMDLQRDAALCEFLGGAGDGRAVDALFKALQGSDSGPADLVAELRLRSAEGLARLRKSVGQEMADQATETVLKLVEQNRDRRVRSLLVKTLGQFRSPAAVRPLVMLLEDKAEKDLHLKRNIMGALMSLDAWWGVRSVARLLKSDEPYLREAALQSLKPVTGSDFGIDPASPVGEAEFAKIKSWWEKKYSKAWDQEE